MWIDKMYPLYVSDYYYKCQQKQSLSRDQSQRASEEGKKLKKIKALARARAAIYNVSSRGSKTRIDFIDPVIVSAPGSC
jgi:hypothetical protein